MKTESQLKMLKGWVFALRSGAYLPNESVGEFYSGDRCGCAVGVLGMMTNQRLSALTGACTLYKLMDASQRFLWNVQAAIDFLNLVGLSSEEMFNISNMFEGFDGFARHSFSQVADYIERTHIKPEELKIISIEEEPCLLKKS